MELEGHIFFIGFMGSGKSFIGSAVAQKLNIPFYDLDWEIENYSNSTVEKIFEQKGEEFFRQLESKILGQTVEKEFGIISLGGGTPCFNDNMNFINKIGTTIFIDTSLNLLLERLSMESQHRPLLKNMVKSDELKSFIEFKFNERKPIYQLSKYTFYQTQINQDQLIDEITEFIKSSQ